MSYPEIVESGDSRPGPFLSVVIRSRNEEKYLPSVLAALRAQKCGFSWEVILVDNQSEDATLQAAEAFGCKIVAISKEDFTYGRAINLGIEHARGEIILLLSAHSLPIGSNFLEKCAVPFIDPAVAAARCISTSDQVNLARWHQPEIIQYPSVEAQKLIETGTDWLKKYPAAACCILRRSVWEEIRFDETLEAVEDKEWASRVLKRGYKIVNSAECLYYYLKPLGETALLKKQQREFLALYRINGYVPLSQKWFIIRSLQAFFEAPGVAVKHIQQKLLKNYYLVTIPSLTKKPPQMGGKPEFDRKENVRH